jgi:hypothetical protein
MIRDNRPSRYCLIHPAIRHFEMLKNYLGLRTTLYKKGVNMALSRATSGVPARFVCVSDTSLFKAEDRARCQ